MLGIAGIHGLFFLSPIAAVLGFAELGAIRQGQSPTGGLGFARAGALIETGPGKFALWITLAALAYHFIAGIRHLLLDVHVGDSRVGARRSAWTTLGLSFLAAAAAGAWLW